MVKSIRHAFFRKTNYIEEIALKAHKGTGAKWLV